MTNDLIKDYLINNKEHLMKLTQPMRYIKSNLLKKYPEVFSDYIKEQYFELTKSIIIQDITKALAVSTEDVILVLEEINVEEYLK